ncbi:MAG: hypothetical protein JWO54_220 [Candidatus Saccharibacteria bacterium]|nr:hypothetical protein [Candidatus Saccharibacteria bacterium]
MGFSPGGSGSIATSSDVSFSNLASGQVLTYDTTTQKWKNVAASAGLLASKDTAASGNSTFTAGSTANLTKFTGTLSADRVITLAAAAANSYFDLSFIDTVFNGFSVTISNGTFSHSFSYPTFIKYLNIAGTWERVL